MVSLSDMLKLLDQLPVWKTLKTMPARIEALEQRLDALEQTQTIPKSPGQPCPSCGENALRRTSSKISSGPFGALGAKDEIWTCETCGETDQRFGVK